MKDKFINIDIKSNIPLFNDIINIKYFDSNSIKIDKKSYKNILICYIGCKMTKDSKYLKINNANLLYFVISKVNKLMEINI